MARIRKADDRLDAEFSHDTWEDDQTADFTCPNCEDVPMTAANGSLVWRCPDCHYAELRSER